MKLHDKNIITSLIINSNPQQTTPWYSPIITNGSTNREILIVRNYLYWILLAVLNLEDSLFALVLHSTEPENYFILLWSFIWLVNEKNRVTRIFYFCDLPTYHKIWVRKVWRYQGHKSKDRWQKNDKEQKLIYLTTQKTKDRATKKLLKTGGEFRCSRRVSSFCSTSGTSRCYSFTVLVCFTF